MIAELQGKLESVAVSPTGPKARQTLLVTVFGHGQTRDSGAVMSRFAGLARIEDALTIDALTIDALTIDARICAW